MLNTQQIGRHSHTLRFVTGGNNENGTAPQKSSKFASFNYIASFSDIFKANKNSFREPVVPVYLFSWKDPLTGLTNFTVENIHSASTAGSNVQKFPQDQRRWLLPELAAPKLLVVVPSESNGREAAVTGLDECIPAGALSWPPLIAAGSPGVWGKLG